MSNVYPLHSVYDSLYVAKLKEAQRLISEVTTAAICNNGDDHSEDAGYQTYLHLASELIERCIKE